MSTQSIIYSHTHTLAAGIVGRVQYLVFGTGTLSAVWNGQTQTAAASIVDATRVGACGREDESEVFVTCRVYYSPVDVWSRDQRVREVSAHLAAAERRTFVFQRWVVARRAAEWRRRWWCPTCKCCHCGTRSRTGSVYNGTGQRRGSVPDPRTPSGQKKISATTAEM